MAVLPSSYRRLEDRVGVLPSDSDDEYETKQGEVVRDALHGSFDPRLVERPPVIQLTGDKVVSAHDHEAVAAQVLKLHCL